MAILSWVSSKADNSIQSVEPGSLDPQPQWLQLGAGFRMAQRLGVHRDGSLFDLAPIETEVRRRVWMQICILDGKFAEHLGYEPTIPTTSFDTCLPLSISDSDLSLIDVQDIASRQNGITETNALREIEEQQEQRSPFSSMTLSLIRAEASRLMAQLFATQYQPRDMIYRATSRSQFRSSTELPTRQDQTLWIQSLQARFQDVYQLDGLDVRDPLQFIVVTLAEISTAKANFINRLMQWRDGYRRLTTTQREDETTRYVFLALVAFILTTSLPVDMHLF